MKKPFLVGVLCALNWVAIAQNQIITSSHYSKEEPVDFNAFKSSRTLNAAQFFTLNASFPNPKGFTNEQLYQKLGSSGKTVPLVIRAFIEKETNRSTYLFAVLKPSVNGYNGVEYEIVGVTSIDSNQSFLVDFADGKGFRPIKNGDKVNVTYADTGKKTLYMKVNNGTADEYTIASTVETSSIDFPSQDDTWDLASEIPFTPPCPKGQGYPIAYGRAYIRYHSSLDKVLRKPLIFVEGFDALVETHGNYRYERFGWDVFSTGGYDSETGKHDVYYMLEKSPDFIRQMNDLGYDIILLDFLMEAIT